MTTQKRRHYKNATRKNKGNKMEDWGRGNLSALQKFEEKFEEGLDKRGNDVIQKELIHLFNIPFTPSKYTPKNLFTGIEESKINFIKYASP